MKKIFFGFLATAMFSTLSFANTPTLESEIDVKNESLTENKKPTTISSDLLEDICSTTCSRTVGGVTYTTSAGNWFSSCERADRRCQEKLDQFLGE